MKNFLFLCTTLCLIFSGITQTTAQDSTTRPPPAVLLIEREEIKPGKMPAHTQEARGFLDVMSRANSRLGDKMRDGRLAMTPIAGNQNEVAYIWPYDSFEDMESKRKETDKLATGAMKVDFDQLPDAELHASQRSIIASYRPDYSYNPGRMNVAQARYMAMTTLRIKPGHASEYWDMVKRIVNPARDKAQLKASFAVYQVRAGMMDGFYLIFRPMKSLAELDFPLTAVRDAMGKEGREDADKVADRAVLLGETVYYAFNPQLSLVGPEFAAADPAFWNQKPAMTVTTAMPRRRQSARRSGPQ